MQNQKWFSHAHTYIYVVHPGLMIAFFCMYFMLFLSLTAVDYAFGDWD